MQIPVSSHEKKGAGWKQQQQEEVEEEKHNIVCQMAALFMYSTHKMCL